ncbi:MAG TPA: RdgB/HAM1 family non-canonical purine NTP pyrophosphatase [Tepidisphaeraceae bacterium]|jgi:XTP/dITP diphosphohydrolase|nr:RdgB/HAM1 family non-canonical purine NTP pyrophosphatase [Tepidisphaeraceae bacterium]
MKLLVATKNAGKVREFADLLRSTGFDCVALSSLDAEIPTPEETGETFRANACLKATYYARAAQSWALADDSGLEVDALDGKPGVVSSRWAELHDAGSGDAANNVLLLQQMIDVPEERRTARFVCVLALADPAGRIVLTARDTIEGRLLSGGRGGNGFGYDPLFLVQALGRTTAELTAAEKHEISHRGKALRRLRSLMQEFLPMTPSTQQQAMASTPQPTEL